MDCLVCTNVPLDYNLYIKKERLIILFALSVNDTRSKLSLIRKVNMLPPLSYSLLFSFSLHVGLVFCPLLASSVCLLVCPFQPFLGLCVLLLCGRHFY